MRYCIKCILPDSRPNLVIDEVGICSACTNYKKKPFVSREDEFEKIAAEAKEKNRDWDCVIPVSGGKDSTWQVIKALEYKLKPLCVTWKTPARSSHGQRNLDNLISLGVDHIDFAINPKVEKKFTLETFRRKGSTAIPMHMALFSIPLQIATKFNIPLVLWGENSGVEYGGNTALGAEMNNEWLLTYGVTQGTIADDWISNQLSAKDLSSYRWPSDKDLKKSDVKPIFLGHFFNWDPEISLNVAQQHGFKKLDGDALVGVYDYADIDDTFLIPVHHWVKWFKFGFTRAWDNLSIEIRNGRITRDKALKILKNGGTGKPSRAIEEFCKWSGISISEFNEILEKFRNKNIWFNSSGVWQIRNFICNDWNWQSED